MGSTPLFSSDLFFNKRASAESVAPTGGIETSLAQYGVPLARQLARREDRRGQVIDLAKTLAADMPSFDFDEFRAAIAAMVEQGYLGVVQRDPVAGDHVIELTKRGWMLAA